MITAANARPLRAWTDRDLLHHSDQLVVLVVETHRVEAVSYTHLDVYKRQSYIPVENL